MNQTFCKCGSGRDEKLCCDEIICGKRNATSCLELMRSRYVAFTRADMNYLIKSHYSKTCHIEDYKSSKQWALSVKWLGLSVINTQFGEAGDETGYVEFRALYLENGMMQQIHERSFFRRENGIWKYVSGDHF